MRFTQYQNGIETKYSYDSVSQLTKLEYVKAGVPLASLYYDASVGRFMTRDPQLKTISTSAPDCVTCEGAHRGCGTSSGLNIYNPSDLHPYVYVWNNPVNISDPYGEAGTLIDWDTCDQAYREFKAYQEGCEEERSGCRPPGPTCKGLKDWMSINRNIVKRCGETGSSIISIFERIVQKVLGNEPPLWWQ